MTINKITITETSLNLHLSDHSVRGWSLVDPVASFLFSATLAQRNNWDIIEQGKVVRWPDLGRTLSVYTFGEQV